MSPRLYLAGPEVFFPGALEIGEAKKRICAAYGFTGHFPLDNTVEAATGSPEGGFAIGRANEDLIAACDAVIANLTPFRGVSADPGTVFEIGYAAGLGKAVHGYSCDPRPYAARVRAADPLAGNQTDAHGLAIEDFGLADNLMIEGAIHRRGGVFLAQGDANLAVFEALLRRLANSPARSA